MVLTRLIGWPAAILATLITLALVTGEIADAGQRRWWAAHPLTTDTVAGLLVLLVTILVVNQLLNRRQARQRGHAVAAQAAIVVAQASRSARAVSSVIDGSGDRDAASDGFRTYMLMLLVGAPVLIDDTVARRFLEQAQYLGGVMAGALAMLDRSADGAAAPGDRTGSGGVPGKTGSGGVPHMTGSGGVPGKTGSGAVPGDRLGDAMRQLQQAAAPLLALLHPAIRDSIQGIGRTAEE